MVLVLLLLVGRAKLEGHRALVRCDERRAAGDVVGAIAAASWGARWYVPGLSETRGGYDRLRAIGLEAEADGKTDTALLAWQSIRASVYGTRGLWTPFPDRLAEANDHLALLMARAPRPGVDRQKTVEELLAEHRALLATSLGGSPWSVVALWLGLAAVAVGSREVLIQEPWRNPGRASRRALLGVAGVVVGVVLFATGAFRG